MTLHLNQPVINRLQKRKRVLKRKLSMQKSLNEMNNCTEMINGQHKPFEYISCDSINGGITHLSIPQTEDDDDYEEIVNTGGEKIICYIIGVISGVSSFIGIGHFIISLIAFANTPAAIWSGIASIPATFNLHVYVLKYRNCLAPRSDGVTGWYPVMILGAIFTFAGFVGCAIHITYGILQTESFTTFSQSSYLSALWSFINGVYGLSVLISTITIYKKLPYYPPWGDIF